MKFSLVLSIFLLSLLLSCSSKHEAPAVVADTTKTAHKDSVKHPAKVEHRVDSTSFVDPHMAGRCVCVSLCGVDSRLNDGVRHADANHVIKFWLDSGAVEIIDIPRDTPMDAGLDSNLNILTNVRANRGRKVYLDSVAKIARCKKIDYYCEVGFSQALGVLELLGHKDDAAQTLRALRSRQGFDAGDFQRCFNQGNFIAQVLTRHFSTTTGWFRDPVLRAALLLAETNMPLDTIKSICDKLAAKGFPDNGKCYVHIMPNFGYHLKAYDFDDAEHVKAINQQIDARLERAGVTQGAPTASDYANQLETIIQRATADTAKAPKSCIAKLRRIYDQRAWMQLQDASKRSDAVKRICTMLVTSYTKTHQSKEALEVTAFYEQQRQLFE